MKRLIPIFAILLVAWGPCQPKPVPVVVAPVGPSTAAVTPATDAVIEAKDASLSKVSASAGVILEVNANQPAGPNTEGVKSEAMLQQTIAGPARPADEADALKRKLAVQSGDLTKIKTAYATAQTDAQKANDRADKAEADLKTAQAKAATEQANAAAVLQKQIDKIQTDADARVKQVQDAERKAWLSKLNYVLLGMGALLILAGVATAWLTGGADLAKSLILAAGGALCFGLDYTLNQPWFQYVAIGSVVLTVIGTGVWAYIEWRDHKADKVAAVVDTSAQKVVATLDTAYESATPEIKAVLDPIFSKLGNNMDAAEKDAIKLLRYKATVTAPAAPSPEIPTQPKT